MNDEHVTADGEGVQQAPPTAPQDSAPAPQSAGPDAEPPGVRPMFPLPTMEDVTAGRDFVDPRVRRRRP